MDDDKIIYVSIPIQIWGRVLADEMNCIFLHGGSPQVDLVELVVVDFRRAIYVYRLYQPLARLNLSMYAIKALGRCRHAIRKKIGHYISVLYCHSTGASSHFSGEKVCLSLSLSSHSHSALYVLISGRIHTIVVALITRWIYHIFFTPLDLGGWFFYHYRGSFVLLRRR